MLPDHGDHHYPDMTPGTVHASQKVAFVPDLVAGVLFVLASVSFFMAADDVRLWLFLPSLLFLPAPILAKRILH